MSIAIPEFFALYNKDEREGADHQANKEAYADIASSGGKASDCIACGQCEGICPQKLPIINWLQQAAQKLE